MYIVPESQNRTVQVKTRRIGLENVNGRFYRVSVCRSPLTVLFAAAGIDTDKHKYPIGSGRVTFNNQKSFMKAVAAAFVEIKALKFTKKVNA